MYGARPRWYVPLPLFLRSLAHPQAHARQAQVSHTQPPSAHGPHASMFPPLPGRPVRVALVRLAPLHIRIWQRVQLSTGRHAALRRAAPVPAADRTRGVIAPADIVRVASSGAKDADDARTAAVTGGATPNADSAGAATSANATEAAAATAAADADADTGGGAKAAHLEAGAPHAKALATRRGGGGGGRGSSTGPTLVGEHVLLPIAFLAEALLAGREGAREGALLEVDEACVLISASWNPLRAALMPCSSTAVHRKRQPVTSRGSEACQKGQRGMSRVGARGDVSGFVNRVVARGGTAILHTPDGALCYRGGPPSAERQRTDRCDGQSALHTAHTSVASPSGVPPICASPGAPAAET